MSDDPARRAERRSRRPSGSLGELLRSREIAVGAVLVVVVALTTSRARASSSAPTAGATCC